jgi:ubiquinone/menaquinone biosynthesis C-methylase UbiE
MDLPEEVESYDRLSKNYLAFVERKFIRRLTELLGETPGVQAPLVLDVGTGPANIPAAFLRGQPSVRAAAVDLSPNMLLKARSNLEAQGLAGRVFLVCADSERLPFRDRTFDLVWSHSMFHHLPDPRSTLQELVRVTGSGRRLIVRDLRRPPAPLLGLYVGVFGLAYDRLMKKMYRESLCAGYTFPEMRELAGRVQGAALRAVRFFITHVGLEGVRSGE